MEKYRISLGKSNMTLNWEQYKATWKELVGRLTTTYRTSETFKEFMAMSKDKQGEIKACKGGFVGGALTDGLRRRGHVACHSLITLDLDECPPDILDDLELMCPYRAIIYSTHKHTKAFPRLRLVMPLSRECSEEEYEPLARMVASRTLSTMEPFDKTTYEPTRLMYYPTTSKDGEFYGDEHPGKVVDVDEELARYKDWHDISEWPKSSKEENIRRSKVSELGDPTKKDSIVGSFCSVYDVVDVIEQFLSDKYQEGTIKGRYTYIGGGSEGSNGAVVYNKGWYLYSNHQHDPIHDSNCVNAFDLCRIHMFGDKDVDVDEKEVPPMSRPSFIACKKWAMTIPEVAEVEKQRVAAKAAERAKQEYKIANPNVDPGDDSWKKELIVNQNGQYTECYKNFITILNNDPCLKGLTGRNVFSSFMEVLKPTPWKRSDEANSSWTPEDDAQLFGYINMIYHLKDLRFLARAVEGWAAENAFDPVKKYIETSEWDGVPRVERYFIDYLGADDNEYVRTVTRKMFIAAVARVYKPGCKFDYMVTLVGKQGIGKSHACKNLAGPNGEWFQDTLGGTSNLGDDKSLEKLRGQWIVEMGELAALKKNDRDAVKQFISKQTDTYRGAYQTRTLPYPRRCIFIGTTNDDTFLNDPTGARRFLVIDCHGHSKKKPWDIKPEEVNQLWAEAKVLFDKGENIMDLNDIAEMALAQQVFHTEENEFLGQLEEFLETPIPKDWNKKTLYEKQNYYRMSDEFKSDPSGELVLRDVACAQEFWMEYLQKPRGSSDIVKSKLINAAFDQLGWTETKIMTTKGYKGHRGRLRPKKV